jgi:hypothetical protein
MAINSLAADQAEDNGLLMPTAIFTFKDTVESFTHMTLLMEIYSGPLATEERATAPTMDLIRHGAFSPSS